MKGMLTDRSLTYWERMAFHRRFYIPATLCLFLSFPGSLAAILPSGTFDLSIAQRIETLLLYLPALITYTLFLIWATPRKYKIGLGLIGFAVSFLATMLLIRTTVFSDNFHEAILRRDVVVHHIPGLLMFLVLCVLDQKKRARSIFWSLILLIIPLSISSGKNKKAVKFLDHLRLNDISVRLHQGEPVNEFMTEQCNLISEFSLRQECIVSINVTKNNGTTVCDETEGVTECKLSRGEQARRVISTHPAPKIPFSQ